MFAGKMKAPNFGGSKKLAGLPTSGREKAAGFQGIPPGHGAVGDPVAKLKAALGQSLANQRGMMGNGNG